MRLREHTIGALNLFHRGPSPWAPPSCASGRRSPTWPRSAILSWRSARERELLTEQLQTALNSRVIIEQAKGMLAERAGIRLDEAFERLRGHARATNTRLTDLAARLTEGSFDTTPLLALPRS